MCEAVYNSAIPKAIVKPVKRGDRCRIVARLWRFLFFFVAILPLTMMAHAADWNAAEQQLARKIVAVTGPGAVAVTVENRSSLERRESDAVQNGVRPAPGPLGGSVGEGGPAPSQR